MGANTPPSEPESRQTVLEEAATTDVTNPTPVKAVRAATRQLEADSQFNAGVGSAV